MKKNNHTNFLNKRDIEMGVDCNDLLPGSTKPLPEPVLTCHQWVLCYSHERNFPIMKLHFKIAELFKG